MSSRNFPIYEVVNLDFSITLHALPLVGCLTYRHSIPSFVALLYWCLSAVRNMILELVFFCKNCVSYRIRLSKIASTNLPSD
ncbi:MAG: hypothetical protein GF309_05945 [Candidatus Lokiarchaeota archaeon]|nr:hypothetical protein [Candidatus Lokiarchaeota archaeon]